MHSSSQPSHRRTKPKPGVWLLCGNPRITGSLWRCGARRNTHMQNTNTGLLSACCQMFSRGRNGTKKVRRAKCTEVRSLAELWALYSGSIAPWTVLPEFCLEAKRLKFQQEKNSQPCLFRAVFNAYHVNTLLLTIL